MINVDVECKYYLENKQTWVFDFVGVVAFMGLYLIDCQTVSVNSISVPT